jgi:hypothetical protein
MQAPKRKGRQLRSSVGGPSLLNGRWNITLIEGHRIRFAKDQVIQWSFVFLHARSIGSGLFGIGKKNGAKCPPILKLRLPILRPRFSRLPLGENPLSKIKIRARFCVLKGDPREKHSRWREPPRKKGGQEFFLCDVRDLFRLLDRTHGLRDGV